MKLAEGRLLRVVIRILFGFLLRFRLIEGKIYIVVGKLQRTYDIVLVRPVKYRRRYVKAQSLGCKRKVDLKNLPDIHSRRHAKGIQYDIHRPPVRKVRHILNRKNSRNNTLVSVTACHLVADRNLSLLRNIYSYGLIYSGRELIAVLS